MLFLVIEKEPDDRPSAHPDDFAWFEYEPNLEPRIGLLVIRAAGGQKEAKVVLEVWYDNKYGDNAFREARNLSYDILPLSNDGPVRAIWSSLEYFDE